MDRKKGRVRSSYRLKEADASSSNTQATRAGQQKVDPYSSSYGILASDKKLTDKQIEEALDLFSKKIDPKKLKAYVANMEGGKGSGPHKDQGAFDSKHPYSSGEKVHSSGHTKDEAHALVGSMRADGTHASSWHQSGPKTGASSKYFVTVPSGHKESQKVSSNLQCRLLEGDAKDGSRFKVCLIQEGLGNFKDGFFYTREALEQAVQDEVFEGKKIYANHPSVLDEENRPERDVKEVLGHFENCTFEEVDSRGEIHADLIIPDGDAFDWARAMAEHAVKYADKYRESNKEFVGLSINASGDAKEEEIDEVMKTAPEACLPKLQEAKENDVTAVMVVSEINNAVSVDLVTEAGAGGKIIKLMEEAKSMSKVKKVVKAKENAGGDDATGGGDDAAKDAALINQLIQKHMGDKGADGMDEEEKASVHESMKNYAEAGMAEEEAMKCAMAQHKMEKHMKQKKEGAGKTPPPPPPKKDDADDGDDGATDHEEKEVAESAKSVVALSGRVAFLEKELTKERLAKHVDKKLSESGLPMKATKLFVKEAKSFKDEKDFDSKFAIFSAAYNVEKDDSFTFVPMTEKSNGNNQSESGADFSDCADD